MDVDRIKKRLHTSLFGWRIFYKEEIDSTNEYAMRLANEGAPEGTLILTDFQTAGKGRLDREWFSTKGKNLLVSLLLRPELEVEAVQKITLATATILIESIKGFLKNRKIKIKDLEVKWPNDVLLKGKKLCGVLAESKLQNKQIEALVLGIGLNLNMSQKEMSGEIKKSAISLIDEIKKPIIIEDFLAYFLKRFEKDYEKFERTNYSDAVRNWKKHCKQFGKPILIHAPDSEERGYFHDIHEDGYLIYRTEDGELKRLVAGDIERV